MTAEGLPLGDTHEGAEPDGRRGSTNYKVKVCFIGLAAMDSAVPNILYIAVIVFNGDVYLLLNLAHQGPCKRTTGMVG